MKVGTIGSGVIVDRMIEAMNMTPGMEVCAIYSRTLARAQEFARKHQVSKYYDDLDAMLKDEKLDTIYVASPNGLHYLQSKKALLAGKHVICEKPFVPTVEEAKDLFAIAKQKGVYIFEAITTIHLPNYQIVRSHLKDLGDIKLIQCNFSQYSSRYEKYKAHEVTNVFDPAFAGGALMDINVYCLHFVIGLFGKPDTVQYVCNRGFNGVDTSGTVLLSYPDMLALCTGAKDSSSPNHVYIQGDQGTIRVYGSSCGVCSHVEILPTKGDMIGKKDTSVAHDIGLDQKPHMVYECEDFLSIIQNRDCSSYEKLCKQTLDVVSILEECQKQSTTV